MDIFKNYFVSPPGNFQGGDTEYEWLVASCSTTVTVTSSRTRSIVC